ncbi:hypothetical protein EE612_022599, partial [Oryza sativa]
PLCVAAVLCRRRRPCLLYSSSLCVLSAQSLESTRFGGATRSVSRPSAGCLSSLHHPVPPIFRLDLVV